jgi:hypothetical protein
VSVGGERAENEKYRPEFGQMGDLIYLFHIVSAYAGNKPSSNC